jgi:hypothetical protein
MELLHTTPLQQSVVGVGNVGQFTLAHRLMQPLIIANASRCVLSLCALCLWGEYTGVRLYHLERCPGVIIGGRFIWPTAGGLFANGFHALWSFSEHLPVISHEQANDRTSFQVAQLFTRNAIIVRSHTVSYLCIRKVYFML